MVDSQPGRARFGDFELDLKGGELWHGASKVVLQEQSFRVLRILVENDGEIVSREEIQRKLWPHDTIVEFDRGINAVINKLRQLLGDSAKEPTYIETIARRGYRLIVPVEWLAADSSSGDGVPVGAGPAVRLTTETELIGKRVSHYRVIQAISRGGMGMVYRAEDLKLPRHVALKFLPQEMAHDPVALQRFEREAQAASSLDHPNICTIYEVEEYEQQPFIVMQLLEGQTLRDFLSDLDRGRQALSLDRLLDIAIQIADGLQAAHDKGIIHRDIKPANIFLTALGQVKILDFGLAKLVTGTKPAAANQTVGPEDPTRGLSRTPRDPNDSLTRAGSAMGTAAYMSPEQVRGEQLDARTDLFSYGVVLYEMATCRRAFSGETSDMVEDAILNRVPLPVHELNSMLPRQLEPVINKALEKDREQRYQSAREMRTALDEIRRAQEPAAPSPPSISLPTKKWKRPLAILLLCAVAGAAAVYWYVKNRQVLTDKDSIVVADLSNKTTDPAFDDALNPALRVALGQTPFLKLLSPDKVRGTLKAMNRPDKPITPELAREVCLRTNSTAVIAPSITDLGNRYRLQIEATNCQTGKRMAAAQVEADSRGQTVRALGNIAAELRRKLGEPGASLKAFNRPLDEATTGSLEAWQAFGLANALKHQHGETAASDAALKRALELDPNFVQAYLVEGTGYLNKYEVELSIQTLRRAYDLRNKLTERDRLAVDSFYHTATGEWDKSVAAFAEMAKKYPRDSLGPRNLAAILVSLGRYEQASEAAQEAIRLSPSADSYVNLMKSYTALNRLDDAKATFDAAQARKMDDVLLYFQRYELGFLQKDPAAMQQSMTWAAAKPNVESMFLCLDSSTEAYYGRMPKARALADEAVDSAIHTHNSQFAAECTANAALQEAEIGDRDRARQKIAAALQLNSERRIQALAALAAARIGDLEQAERLSDQLNQRYPLDLMVQSYLLPTIRAVMEMQRNQPQQALQTLQVTRSYENGFEAFGSLYPAYVRGEAYLKSGLGQQAAPEFQKMIDNPGIVGNSILGALAHLQLARAQAMMGDNAAARKSYQDFLNLWKDADPSIPILKQAKTEYARLQ